MMRKIIGSIRREWWVILLLTGLILAFLGRGLKPGWVWLPLDIVVEGWPPWQEPDRPPQIHNPLLGDAVNYIYPIKEFTADAVRQGILPLWNPYVMGGYPLTYNTQAGLFYPLSIFYYLWPGAPAVNLTILVQMLLGAGFAYLYLRLICARRLAAVTGVIIFLFNGMMIVWLSWQAVHAAMIWLPLQLYFAERLVRSLGTVNSERYTVTGMRSAVIFALLTGLALAVPWLGGHWNWTLYTSMTLGVYLLWQLWPYWRAGGGWRVAGLAGLPLLVGLAVSLVQVWPAAAYLAQSHRQPFAFAESLSYGLWNRGAALLVPNFFGNPVAGNWWGHSNYNETTLYMGILPLFLAGLVLWLRRDRVTLFWAGWGLLGLLWTLGTPLYGLLYLLPVFGGLLPSRAATIVAVAVAFLAALAMDRLLDEEEKAGVADSRLWSITLYLAAFFLLVVALYALVYRAEALQHWAYLQPQLWLFLVLLAGSLLLLWVRLRRRLSGSLFGGLVVGWLVLDLFLFGYDYNAAAPVTDLYPETAVAQFLQADTEPFRIATLPVGTVYPPNTSLAPRLANVSGYEPGIAQRYLNYMTLAEGGSPLHWEREVMPLHALGSPLLDVLNLKYLVTIADWWGETAVPDRVQPDASQWRTLLPDQAMEQPFTMSEAGLQRLDLRLATPDPLAGEVMVRVLAADGGQEFAHAVLAGPSLATDEWHSFYFTPFPSEWGREFLLRLTVTGGTVEVGVAETAAAAPDSLRQNGELQPYTLALAAYYLPRPQLLFEAGKTRVYLNDTYYPRAYAVPQAMVVAGEAAALAALEQEMGRLDQVVILELAGQPPPPPTAASSEPFTAAVVITDYQLNRVRLTADLPQAGFVVLADNYYPGWRATVNGEETAVYRANSILRAIYLPAGRHEIDFYFRPLDFILGGIVSALSLFVCCLAILILCKIQNLQARPAMLDRSPETGYH